MGYLEFRLNHPTEITREVGGRGISQAKNVKRTVHAASVLSVLEKIQRWILLLVLIPARKLQNAKERNHYLMQGDFLVLKSNWIISEILVQKYLLPKLLLLHIWVKVKVNFIIPDREIRISLSQIDTHTHTHTEREHFPAPMRATWSLWNELYINIIIKYCTRKESMRCCSVLAFAVAHSLNFSWSSISIHTYLYPTLSMGWLFTLVSGTSPTATTSKIYDHFIGFSH